MADGEEQRDGQLVADDPVVGHLALVLRQRLEHGVLVGQSGREAERPVEHHRGERVHELLTLTPEALVQLEVAPHL